MTKIVSFPSWARRTPAETPGKVRSFAIEAERLADKVTGAAADVFDRFAQDAESFRERELALLSQIQKVRGRMERLTLEWSARVPSEITDEIQSIQEEMSAWGTPATQQLKTRVDEVKALLAHLQFRDAYPIVAELDPDSLIPNARDHLPSGVCRQLQRLVTQAERGFVSNRAKSDRLMEKVARRIFG